MKKEAESLRIAISAEKVQQAKALEEAYSAEQKAESARSDRERATQVANIIVPAEISKQRAVSKRKPKPNAYAKKLKGSRCIYAKMEAEAKGLPNHTKQAEGYKDVVGAAGGDPTKAFQLLLIEKLPELVKPKWKLLRTLRLTKITVWDSGKGEDGNNSTANFVSGMMKTVPPLNDLFNMAGLNLPTYLANNKTQENKSNTKYRRNKCKIKYNGTRGCPKSLKARLRHTLCQTLKV